MVIFGPKPWVNPFANMSVFRLFKLLVFIAQKGFFLLQYRERHFSCLGCLKKQVGIMVIFGQKPLVNTFVKMSFFRLFKLLVFIAQKRVFFVLKYRKRHFPCLYCLKKKFGKMAIFGRKPWVNSFGKMSIFRLSDVFVFLAQKGVFSFQNIVIDIFLAYIA